jgi:hypothetical protein
MTPEQIGVIAGIVISIGFEYIPGLHDWYNNLINNYQRLVMLGVLFLVTAVLFGLGCAGLLSQYWACTTAGAFEALKVFIAAVIANQATYLVLPKQNGA